MTTDSAAEALRLADALDEVYGWHNYMTDDQYKQAAAELRRLHAENEDYGATIDYLTCENAEQIGEIVVLKEQRDELLGALKQTLAQCLVWQGDPDEWSCSIHKAIVEQARAAIAKATKDAT